MLGSDHAFKIGGYWRDSKSSSYSHRGGFATVRFPNEAAYDNGCPTQASGCQVDLVRDGNSAYDLSNISVYGQDTIRHDRMTLQLGVRYDRIHDSALAATIDANPLSTEWLPAINFPGADPGIVFNNFSPRVGMTFDFTGDGRTQARANYARYYGQVGNGGIASAINPVGATTLRYPWIDANGDKVAQANEILTGPKPLSASTNWSAANPANTVSANSVDPSLRDDTTDEVIIGLDREVAAGFAVGVSYIWRRYGNFNWNDRQDITSADWVPVSYTPNASSCPAGADCPTVTYYEPTFQQPTVVTETNVPGFNRTYNGFELTASKRMRNHWMLNTSLSLNSTVVNFDGFPGSQPSTTSATISEDPTNRDMRDGYQYDYLTSGSGIGNVYVNAKWMYKLSGVYEAPLGLSVSAFYNARQGYPQEITVQSPSRHNGAGTVDVLLNPVGDTRLPTFQNLDLRIERAIHAGKVTWRPSMSVFNVFNANTIQAIRSRQNASNANDIQAIVAPRVIQFGIKMAW
jgi:hypothetical protein